MMSPNPNMTDTLDWEALTTDSLDLTPAAIEHAAQISQAIADPDQQWQVYLNTLARLGLEQWLSERAPDLALSPIPSPTHPTASGADSTLLDTVWMMQVGDFKVCVLAIASLPDTVVSVPSAVVDAADLVAQFYILVNVLEEQEQVSIAHYLRQDQMMTLRSHAQPLTADTDGNYSVPLSWFNADPDQLLLELRCLQPISLSQITSTQESTTMTPESTSPSSLSLSSSPSPSIPPSSPSPLSPSTSPSLSSPSLNQRAINVGLWLHDQLDELAQELSWVLMPAFTPAASAMRSAVEEFQAVTHQLEAAGLAIAPEARGAYRDLRWGNVALRLYVMTWALPFDPGAPNQPPEWSLLLILGAQPSASLPLGVGLRVQDQMQVLVERVFGETSQDSYLYARVVGTWDEQFWVTLNLANGVVITLPPFSFDPDRVE